MKSYFGDGIYAEVTDEGRVILTTENGFSITNTIIFDEGVFEQLAPFVKRLTVEVE